MRRSASTPTSTYSEFQSTHPARGATAPFLFRCDSPSISIHAPREGCDSAIHSTAAMIVNFNPRTPRGVRLYISGRAPRYISNFNPRTPRGVRLRTVSGEGVCIGNFNPRTPRGVRLDYLNEFNRWIEFQSTHPARGATRKAGVCMGYELIFQSTHPARGATTAPMLTRCPLKISIHAPREGCDGFNRTSAPTVFQFQSTHPARGATPHRRQFQAYQRISIHAPREGCDLVSLLRPPRAIPVFQSTHPARGATSDIATPDILHRFQSTHPARGATTAESGRSWDSRISIHAPREGCDWTAWDGPPERKISIHAPREGCDGLHRLVLRRTHSNFNPRTPRGVRQQTLPKSREFAWLNLLICTRGRRLSIQKQTRLCSIKLSFMLFGCEPAGEGVSSWTSHATKSKVRLEGRSA